MLLSLEFESKIRLDIEQCRCESDCYFFFEGAAKSREGHCGLSWGFGSCYHPLSQRGGDDAALWWLGGGAGNTVFAGLSAKCNASEAMYTARERGENNLFGQRRRITTLRQWSLSSLKQPWMICTFGWKQITRWRKKSFSSEKITQTHYSGRGRPEQLRHKLRGYWFRRINTKDRIIYWVDDEAATMHIMALKCQYF